MGTRKDITGQKFGKWTPIKYIANGRWLCECECGTEKTVLGQSLRNGSSKSCGCNPGNRLKYNFQNISINEIDVFERIKKEQYTEAHWRCYCNHCNNFIIQSTSYLKNNPQYCSKCVMRENIKRNALDKTKDITGNIFGFLKAIQPTKERRGTSIVWECLCLNCNSICYYSENVLTQQRAHSCGCYNNSYGELKIAQLLQQNNIKYIRQKSFNTCRFEDTKYPARFDFYVNDNYLIEFDSEQHFKNTNGWYNEERLKKTQQHDIFKNNWCKNNNISLIRIPYTKLKSLVIEDLLLETSTFII